MRIHISEGNMKLGKVPNISLPPVVTCRDKVPCRNRCYARKAYRLYPNVKKNWDENLEFYRWDSDRYFGEIRIWLSKNNPEYFRWHVAGDCPDGRYLVEVLEIAQDFFDTQFMMFTKRWDLLKNGTLPENLAIILSMWPRLKNPEELDFPRAWLSTDKRKPAHYFKCPGKCDVCYRCWELVRLGYDVVFDPH